MICDFNNEVSMRYVELSLESFKPVEDLISITPIQCTTPATLPIRFQENQEPIPFYVTPNSPDYLRPRHYGGTFCDDTIYNCIMHSHMQLVKRIADGEELAIMEHDAALVDEDSFREMFDMFWGCDMFFPGACMEFYGLSQRVAEWMWNLCEDFPYCEERTGWINGNQRFSGPMGVLSAHKVFGFNPPNPTVLCPTKWRPDLDKIAYSQSMYSCQNGEGVLFEPACKQYYFTKTKNTNSPDYSDIMEDETLDYSASGPMRRDFVFIEG